VVVTLPLVDRFRRLPPADRAAFFAKLALVPGALADLRYDFEGTWARPDQVVTEAEVDRGGLVVFSGPRGSGKTRAAVQLFNREILSGRARRPRIFAANEGDVDKAVVHGESGIMRCLPPEQRPEWIRGEGPAGVLRYRTPHGVTEAVCFTAKAPEGAVSHQGDLDLYDDVAKWGPSASTAWGHARLSCRIGYACGIVATTRRGTLLLRKLLAGNMAGVLVRRPADPRANKANLNAGYFDQMAAELEGSDLLAQELDDEEIDTGSPFAGVDFSALRAACLPHDVVTIGVWVDPATSSAARSCDVGVVVVALDARGVVYGVEDCSGRMNAGEWPAVALDAYERWSRIAPTHLGIETNAGGNMGPALLRQEERIRRMRAGGAGVSVIEVIEVNSKKSKVQRAGPVARLIPAGQLKMLHGLGALEKQLRELSDDEGKKNDRADAFVHGVLQLALGAYSVGGTPWEAGPVGPAALGSINVGATTQARAFQFGTPAGWR
jgi:phage terminase large subunit-like protein